MLQLLASVVFLVPVASLSLTGKRFRSRDFVESSQTSEQTASAEHFSQWNPATASAVSAEKVQAQDVKDFREDFPRQDKVLVTETELYSRFAEKLIQKLMVYDIVEPNAGLLEITGELMYRVPAGDTWAKFVSKYATPEKKQALLNMDEELLNMDIHPEKDSAKHVQETTDSNVANHVHATSNSVKHVHGNHTKELHKTKGLDYSGITHWWSNMMNALRNWDSEDNLTMSDGNTRRHHGKSSGKKQNRKITSEKPLLSSKVHARSVFR